MLSPVKNFILVTGALGLVGCGIAGGGSGDAPVAPSSAPAPNAAVPDSPVLIGAPYSVGGRTYTPSDAVDYDEVGYASWYGAELDGRPTANGETFHPNWVTAAHRTLPIPSYVEVTRLDTGRTILVRVNDRGPADDKRLIDLSAGAAEQLGIAGNGVVQVRVRRTNPLQAERLSLRTGGIVPARLDTPDSLLSVLRERVARLPVPANYRAAAPSASVPPASTPSRPTTSAPAARHTSPTPTPPAPPAPVPTPAGAAGNASPPTATTAPSHSAPVETGTFIVQLGAFSSQARADALARRFSARVDASGGVYRVRLGPYASRAEAEGQVQQLRRRGHPGAVVQRAP